MGDEINNPGHYTEGRDYEPIKVICDWELGFLLGNVVKYIARAGRKESRLQDLKKARFYLDEEIQREENYEVSSNKNALFSTTFCSSLSDCFDDSTASSPDISPNDAPGNIQP